MTLLDLRLWWLKWRMDHRLVTLGHVGRTAQRIANEGPGPGIETPGVAHWLALDRLTRELSR